MEAIAERFVFVPGEKPREGGMAVVRRAIDMQDGQRSVAIKLPKDAALDDPHQREAFSRELRALQRLEHPNIVRVIDFERSAARSFMALEWVPFSLTEHIAQRPVKDWGDFYARIGQPILEALSFALSHDVVHRDLKPGNVLVDEHGTVKLSDFGIAKFRNQGPGGATLGEFKSRPYAPRVEVFSDCGEDRDAHAFAVLALQCFASTKLQGYEEFAGVLATLPGPQAVKAVLAKAVDDSPDQRFPSVIQLQAAFDEIARSELAERARRVCYVRLQHNAIVQISEEAGFRRGEVERALQDDLNEVCVVMPWQNADGEPARAGVHVTLFTPQFRLHVAVDRDRGDHLVAFSCALAGVGQLDYVREQGWRPLLDFRVAAPPAGSDGREVMDWLVASFNEHESDRRRARQAERENEIFKEWAQMLRFREQVDEQRHKPIRFDGYEIRGSRVRFSLEAPLSQDAIEQPRMVQLDGSHYVAGEVERVGPDYVELWMHSGSPERLPRVGELVFDSRANRSALNRQRVALDAVRFDRCVEPKLRRLLIDPSAAPAPDAVSEPPWAQGDLDDDKKEAVRKAVGTRGFLVVEGPPGTGKTRFITEAIIQLLAARPNGRILLTSQTHVALDNALERLHELQPDLPLVRIAKKDDPRVADSVRHLVLENQAQKLCKTIAQSSRRFLAAYAAEQGVDANELALGIAAGRLRVELTELQRIDATIANHEDELDTLSGQIAELEAREVSDTFYKLQEFAAAEEAEVARLREQRKRVGADARDAQAELTALGEFGAQLADSGVETLLEWEQGLLKESESAKRCQRLIALSEEWQIRFGRTPEFHAALISSARVVAGTCVGFAGVRGMLQVDFDTCIIDEASKANATEAIVPLSRARRWILVGDRKQLPPFVEGLLDESKMLAAAGLSRESLERTILDRLAGSLPPPCVSTLTSQHRMIRPIGDLISKCFYDGRLRSVNDSPSRKLAAVIPRPVTWLTTASLDRRGETEDHKSFKNLAEVEAIATLIRRIDFLARTAGDRYSVAIISGYAAQLAALQRAMARDERERTQLRVECNTVDAFQGREADICIYSVTRSNDKRAIGFLRDARRLNVALSRGRVALVVVGDHTFCRSVAGDNPFCDVINYIETNPGDCVIQEVAP